MNRFLLALARLLPALNREVVLGDLCECEATKTETFFSLTELILVRALQPYADWRVWVCLGVLPFLTLLHIGIGVALATQVSRWHMGAGGPWSNLTEIFRLSLLLFTASVTSSMSAVWMARRVPLLLLLAALLPAVICFHHYQTVRPASFCVFLFLLPVVCGVWIALRKPHPWFLWFTAAALLLALVCDSRSSDSKWTLLNAFLLLLPALYSLLTLNCRGRNALS